MTHTTGNRLIARIRRPLGRDLGLRLLTFYLLFVGLVVAGAYLSQRVWSERLQADLEAADLALARAIAQETSASMENALQAVRQLAGYPAVIAADEAGMEELFATLMSVRSDVNLVYRLDADGIMIFHYPKGPDSTLGVDFSFREYFVKAQAGRNPLASIGRISPTTGQPVATAVMPIREKGGHFQGLVATNVKLQSLSHALAAILSEYRPEEGFEISIVDSAGQVIAHSEPRFLLSDARQTMPLAVESALSGRPGRIIAGASGADERLISYVPIRTIGWGVIVSRPTSVAFASLIAFQRGMVVAIGLFLVIGLLFWLTLSRLIILPLERLAAFSQAIGQEAGLPVEQQTGVFDLAERSDQIGHLTRTLHNMQQAIDARMNELSTLLRTGEAVVSTPDSQQVLDRILGQVERLMGVNMCAIFALDDETGNFHIQASRGLAPWYIEHVAVQPGEPDSITMRAIRGEQPVMVSDTELNPAYAAQRERARIAGYRSVLGVPLSAQHAPPAALLVYRPDAHQFTPGEINLLSSFANHAAMAIANAALFAQSDMRLQTQTRRLEALIHSMQDGLILEDLSGRVLYANRRMQAICQMSEVDIRESLVDIPMDRILAQAVDRPAAEKALHAAVSGDGDRQATFELVRPDRRVYMRLQIFEVTDSQGTSIGRGRILRDITQLQELDRMKSSLVSTVSHELRTPLAAIKGYASTLLADDVRWDADSQREFLGIISAEADHLSDLVNDLLDMSRIEAGSLKVKQEACDIPELIQRAALRAHGQPGGRLRLDISSNLPTLYADPGRVEVILRNLLENATKYSGDDTPVWLRVALDERQIVFRVEDEGSGIPADQRERIFESFYRVESGLASRTAGTGLGLAIAQGFVRAHGGQIWLEPREIGTCVAFSLPLSMAELVEA